MDTWPYEVKHTTTGEIMLYCTEDEKWQTFRKSLKGISTANKLQRLVDWLIEHQYFDFKADDYIVDRRYIVQVDNYINALLRGGQLVRRRGIIQTREHWAKQPHNPSEFI